MTKTYPITPVAKPRQTIGDRWKKRPCVLRYRAFADECRLRGMTIPESGGTITFYMPMPRSWSKKKKREMDGQPHQQKPDWDNLAKAVCDAVYKDDSGIWDIGVVKLWAREGAIQITEGTT